MRCFLHPSFSLSRTRLRDASSECVRQPAGAGAAQAGDAAAEGRADACAGALEVGRRPPGLDRLTEANRPATHFELEGALMS